MLISLNYGKKKKKLLQDPNVEKYQTLLTTITTQMAVPAFRYIEDCVDVNILVKIMLDVGKYGDNFDKMLIPVVVCRIIHLITYQHSIDVLQQWEADISNVDDVFVREVILPVLKKWINSSMSDVPAIEAIIPTEIKPPPTAPSLPKLKEKTSAIKSVPVKEKKIIKPAVTLFQIRIPADIKKSLKVTLSKEPVFRALHVKKTNNRIEIEKILALIASSTIPIKSTTNINNVAAGHAFFSIIDNKNEIGVALLMRTAAFNKFIIEGLQIFDINLLAPALLSIIQEAEQRAQLYEYNSVDIEISFTGTLNEYITKVLEKHKFELGKDNIYRLSYGIEVKQLENRLMLQLFEQNDKKFKSY